MLRNSAQFAKLTNSSSRLAEELKCFGLGFRFLVEYRGICSGYIGIMEENMKTTIQGLGFSFGY